MTAEKNLNVEKILEHEEHAFWRVAASWFLGFLFLGVVLVVALNIGELEKFYQVIRGIQPKWIILGLLVQACSYISAAGVWHQMLKYSGHPIRFRSLYPLSIAQLFVEQTLPSSGLIGALLVVKGLLNRGVREPIGMGCMIVGMVSYYVAYILAIILSLAILAAYHALNAWLIVLALLFCAIAVGVPTAVLWLRALDIHHKLPNFIKRRKIARAILDMLAQSPVHLLKNRSLTARTILLQLSVFFIDATTLAIMLHAVGYGQPYDIVFASFIMAAVAGAVLPVPLGLGTFEGTCVVILHMLGTPLEAALVAVILLRGFACWLPMIPGFWLARKELRGFHDLNA